MRASADFLVEPFVEGEPGPHVQAAIEAFGDLGLAVELGPFANTVTGDVNRVLAGLEAAMRRSVEAGATRISVDFRVER